MRRHLNDLATEVGEVLEWRPFLRDLDRLQHARIELNGKDWLVRTDAPASVAAVFRQAHTRCCRMPLSGAAAHGMLLSHPDFRRFLLGINEFAKSGV
jgi:hypothetical protein